MAFDFYEDFRTAPVVMIRADSWMGAETAGANGYTFQNEVRVTDGATLTVEAGTHLTFNAGLTVEPGAAVLFEEGALVTFGGGTTLGGLGARLSFAPGVEVHLHEKARVEASELTVAGTAADPVRFVPAASGVLWDRILLRDGPDFAHDLQHVRIEGAAVGLDIRASAEGAGAVSASVGYAQLVGNEVGIATDYGILCSGGFCRQHRSSVALDHVLVEGSTTYGLYLRNTDFDLHQSTIRGSGTHGVFVSNATARSFAGNVIAGNGTAGSGYDGLRVGANGALDFSRRGDVIGSERPALNRIATNTGYQVAALSGSYLFMGSEGLGGGHNSILGTGSACRVHNASGSVLMAEQNFWGTTITPPISYFCGAFPVDRVPFLTGELTGGSGGGYRPGGPLLAASEASGLRGGDGDAGGDPVAMLREQIRATRQALVADPAAPEAASLVRLLAGLHRQDAQGETGEGSATEAVFAALRERLNQPETLPASLRRAAEEAVVVGLEAALARGEVDAASALLAAFEGLVVGEEAALTLGLDAVAVEEALGNYAAALARIEELMARVGEGHDGLSEDLAFLAEVIAAKAEEAGGEAAGRGGALASVAASAEERGGSLPAAFALEPAYPNPAQAEVTVPFALPAPAEVRVEVYDLLGRRVAVLADGRFEAGRHRAAFEASGLPSGVYLLRATMAPAGGAVQAFTQKLTLAR